MLPFFPAGAGGGCGLLFSPFFAMETVGSGARGVRMGEAGSGEENPKTLAEREGKGRRAGRYNPGPGREQPDKWKLRFSWAGPPVTLLDGPQRSSK